MATKKTGTIIALSLAGAIVVTSFAGMLTHLATVAAKGNEVKEICQHSWVDQKIVRAATPELDGVKQMKCINCGDSRTATYAVELKDNALGAMLADSQYFMGYYKNYGRSENIPYYQYDLVPGERYHRTHHFYSTTSEMVNYAVPYIRLYVEKGNEGGYNDVCGLSEIREDLYTRNTREENQFISEDLELREWNDNLTAFGWEDLINLNASCYMAITIDYDGDETITVRFDVDEASIYQAKDGQYYKIDRPTYTYFDDNNNLQIEEIPESKMKHFDVTYTFTLSASDIAKLYYSPSMWYCFAIAFD